MRFVAHAALGFVALVITGAAWPIIAGDTLARPDVVAVSALYLGLRARDQLGPAIASAAAVGYVADVLAGTPIGLLMFSASAICAGSHIAQGRLVVRGRRALVIACGAGSIAMSLLVVALSRAVGVGHHALPLDPLVIAISAVLTATLGAVLFLLHRRLDARLTRRRV